MTTHAAKANKEMPLDNVIVTKSCRVFLRSDGILQVDMTTDAEVTYEDAVEIINAESIAAEGKKRPLLVNSGSVKSMNRDARMYLGGKEAEKIVLANGVVTHTNIAKVIGNFFIGLNKSNYPIRLFTSEETAVKWLKEFLNQE